MASRVTYWFRLIGLDSVGIWLERVVLDLRFFDDPKDRGYRILPLDSFVVGAFIPDDSLW